MTETGMSVEVKKELDEANIMVQNVVNLPVKTAEDYTMAADHVKSLKAAWKMLDDKRKEATKPIDEAKKTIMGWFTPSLDNLKKAIDTISSNMLTYVQAVDDEKARLEAEARAKEEKERARIQAQIDAANANGNAAKAEKLEQKKEAVQVAADAPVVEKQSGLAVSETWYAEVVDIKQMPFEVMGIPVLIADQKQLDKIARDTKGKAVIPGVVFKSKKGIRGVRS